jgi:hypothetical protein
MSDEPRVIDFDALRVARAEKAGDVPAPRAILGGVTYELPRVLPAEFMFALGRIQGGDLTKLEGLIRRIFGDASEEVIAKFDIDDLGVFMQKLPELYGASLGESTDSASS